MTIRSKLKPGTAAQVVADVPPVPVRSRFVVSALDARLLLLIIVLLAVALRIGSALYQGNQINTLPGIYDQVSYDALARRVLQGHGFSFGQAHWPATDPGEPTAFWSFLYTLYLSSVYALFGPNPLPARLIQAVIAGVLQTLLFWRLGKRVFGPTVGLLAAGFGAVYIYFIYYAGALVTETFYITTVLWIMDIILRIDARAQANVRADNATGRRLLIWAELGMALGLATLLRQLALLLVPFLFLWLWWRIAHRRPGDAAGSLVRRWFGWRTLKGFVVTLAILALMILPWTVRNFRVFHTVVLLNTNAGYALFWANHPIYGTQFVGILPGDGPGYGDLLPQELLALNEAEMDKALLGRGIGFILDDPGRYVLLSLSRTREYFKFWPSADSGMVSNISRVASFGLFLPLMIYGVVLAGVRSVRAKNEAWRARVWLLLGFMALYTLMHLLTWTLIRYRLPVDAFLILFAAYGVADLLQRLGAGVGVEHADKVPASTGAA